jgi:hypothetical protein
MVIHGFQILKVCRAISESVFSSWALVLSVVKKKTIVPGFKKYESKFWT